MQFTTTIHDSLSIGIPELDLEHQKLFDTVAMLRLATATEDRMLVLVLLEEIGCHVKLHFVHEERLMQRASYSGYKWHRRQHKAAIVHLAQLLREARGKANGESTFAYLASWLPQHIGLHDRMMSAALRNARRSQRHRTMSAAKAMTISAGQRRPRRVAAAP